MRGKQERGVLRRRRRFAPGEAAARALLVTAAVMTVPSFAQAQSLRDRYTSDAFSDSDRDPWIPRSSFDPVEDATADPTLRTGRSDREAGPVAPAGPEAGTPPPVLAEPPAFQRRRLQRAAGDTEEDPYAQLGIRGGAFLFKPAAEILGGFDSNPRSEGEDGDGAFFNRTEASLDVESDWVRHSLRGHIDADYIAYEDAFSDLNAPSFAADVALRIDARQDLRLDLALRGELDSQDPGDPDLPEGVRGRPQTTQTGATAGITYKPNRLSVALTADVEREAFEDAELNDGTAIDNSDRNHEDIELRLRTGYDLHPGLEPFLEASIEQRRYDVRRNSAGIRHNTDGAKAYLGARVEPNPIWAFEGAIGYGWQEAEEEGLELDGLVARGSLVWRPSVLTTFTLTGEKDLTPTTLECCAVAQQHNVDLRLRHEFRRYLILTANLAYEEEEYAGLDYTLRNWDTGIGLEYKFSRSLSATATYSHQRQDSTSAGEDYRAHIVQIGLRAQR